MENWPPKVRFNQKWLDWIASLTTHDYPITGGWIDMKGELRKYVDPKPGDTARITAGDWQPLNNDPGAWDAGCVAYLAVCRGARGTDAGMTAIPRNTIAAALFGVDADTQRAKEAIAAVSGNLTLQRNRDDIRLYQEPPLSPFIDFPNYTKSYKDVELSPEQAERLGARLIAAAAQIRTEQAKPKTQKVTVEVEIDPTQTNVQDLQDRLKGTGVVGVHTKQYG